MKYWLYPYNFSINIKFHKYHNLLISSIDNPVFLDIVPISRTSKKLLGKLRFSSILPSSLPISTPSFLPFSL